MRFVDSPARWRRTCAARPPRWTAPLLACLLQTGCSIVSPLPLWELTKAAGAAATLAIPYAPTQASNTVYHLHPQVSSLCIEFNPESGVADVVPALQIELRKHAVESRVYEAGTPSSSCGTWLRYVTTTGWGMPPMADTYRAFVSSAALTLQTSGGVVLSSSQYADDSAFGAGRWASTQRKLAPVVSALLTGFQN